MYCKYLRKLMVTLSWMLTMWTAISYKHLDSTVDFLEDEIIRELYGSTNLYSEWVEIGSQNSDEVWETHIIRNKANESKSTILLVHGYGTTSVMAWRNIIPKLIEKYNIVAVDPPGFGRTSASQNLIHASNEDETLSVFCSFYESLIIGLNLTSPYVVGHSFGGYVFAQCAVRWPHLISRLLLADIPGMFPMNGGWDFAWSTFYILGLPHSVIQLLGETWTYNVATFILECLDMEIDDKYISYWLKLQLSPHQHCYRIIPRFLRHRFVYSYGTALVLPTLVELAAGGLPISLAYGVKDTITPLHQGRMLRELIGVPVFELNNTGHVPYIVNEGNDFVNIILAAEHTMPLDQARADAVHCCLHQSLAEINSYVCAPVSFLSNIVLNRLYTFVRSINTDCVAKALSVTVPPGEGHCVNSYRTPLSSTISPSRGKKEASPVKLLL